MSAAGIVWGRASTAGIFQFFFFSFFFWRGGGGRASAAGIFGGLASTNMKFEEDWGEIFELKNGVVNSAEQFKISNK